MKNNKILGKIIDGALNVLIVLLGMFLLVSLYTAVQVKFLGNEYASFFGYSLFEVETGSMHGTIEAGDWIIVQAMKDVERNDIITYKHGSDFVTHRVVEIYKGSYVTKGDANNAKDDPIDREQVVGKVVHILHGFGIVRKIFFNPLVIIFLIICLYLFNLSFKKSKTTLDILIGSILANLKKKIFNKETDDKDTKQVEEKITDNVIQEKVPTKDVPEDKKLDDHFLEDDDESKGESSSIEVVDEDNDLKNDNVLPGEEQKEEILSESSEEEKSSLTVSEEETESFEKEEPIVAENVEVNNEEELSKTSMYRKIDISSEEDNPPIEEVIDEVKAQGANEDDTSKTSVFRIISVDDDIDYSGDVVLDSKKEVEEAPIEKEEKPKGKKIELAAEEVTHREKKKVITEQYLEERMKSKKAKNILDKLFIIKKIVYEEILEVLLENENAYVSKSSMRKQYLDKYMETKYFGLDSERDDLDKIMDTFTKELKTKYIRDERKVKTADAYYRAFNLINHLEKKTASVNYRKEITSFKKVDDEILDQMELDISNIMKYSKEYLEGILEKLETTAFKEQYKKIENQKDLYGVSLEHNISFSRVYSNYIVDKTYSEGIVAEDKIAVLLNILMCKVTKDMMSHDYYSKYIVYLPNALYGKDKKLDKIVSMINNDYAKTHIFFLTTASNMIKNEADFNRLSKQGYRFAVTFNKPIKYNNKNLGYIYLANYYFIDTLLDKKEVCKDLPEEILSQLIEDNLAKKVGDYKGD